MINKQTLANEIGAAADTVASIAKVVAPQFAIYIVLGQALAHAAPELVDDVKALLGKAEPTADDTAQLADKMSGLLNPAAL